MANSDKRPSRSFIRGRFVVLLRQVILSTAAPDSDCAELVYQERVIDLEEVILITVSDRLPTYLWLICNTQDLSL